MALVECDEVLHSSDEVFGAEHVVLQHQVVGGRVAHPHVPEEEGEVQHLRKPGAGGGWWWVVVGQVRVVEDRTRTSDSKVQNS